MTTIKNLVSLIAAIPTPAPKPEIPQPIGTPSVHQCGEVNVFYT